MELIVESMQINNVDVQEAKAGDSIGIKLSDRARRGDTVYKVTG
jgi:selenocysteine-specific translation elongation factor